tara:strand:+ start:311 stop:598 length:288 start_codon:yes stop_codon:yes gene_type:complete
MNNPFKQKITPLKQSPVTTVGLGLGGGFGTNKSTSYSHHATKESCKKAGGCWQGSGKTRESSWWKGEEGWLPDSLQDGKHKKVETGNCYDCKSTA